jgi:predicted ester cyclase
MTPITNVAREFFEACESGGGWDSCRRFCRADATFSGQADPLAELTTLQQYTEWMRGLLTPLPDGRYTLRSFATDAERGNVAAYAVFHGTHSGPGGPAEPTGRRTDTDYVYIMQFENDRIVHMTKVWNSAWALRELGWAS